YASLLSALVRLEEAFGFDPETYGALPSDERPVQIQKWIGGGRTRTQKVPTIANVDTYAAEWYRWWDFMQPEWRRRGSDGAWMVGGTHQWGFLDRPGPNGCLSIVASLYFWGVCENQSTAQRAGWQQAVEDVAWMLEGLELSMK
ncbi:hypothetical protein DFH06DRAFT_1013222, partial [Mycena polygramma]